MLIQVFFFFQAEDGIRDWSVTGVQTFALPISSRRRHTRLVSDWSSDVCSSDLEYVKIRRALEEEDTHFGILSTSLETRIRTKTRSAIGNRVPRSNVNATTDRKSVV